MVSGTVSSAATCASAGALSPFRPTAGSGPFHGRQSGRPPDIDADTFVRDIAPAILPASARVTLYASSNDKALAFSKTVHGYPRAGESGDGLVLINGIDTIDVSAVDTNFVGHFYYGDNRSVLSDLFNLIQGQEAGKRFGLRPRTKNERPYFVFQP